MLRVIRGHGGEGFPSAKTLDSINLGSMVHNNGESRQKDLQRIGLVDGVMDSLSTNIWHC